MEKKLISLLFCLYFSLFLSLSTSLLPIGIHPLDEKFYASDVIKCKDGSNSFTRDRVNDNFCDCGDGTDEPGTAACPNGKFYCKNLGSTPQFLFSSRVNDRICDCCDGSDEYASGAICPNTCVMGGNIAYKRMNHGSATDLDFIGVNAIEKGVVSEDSTQKLSGLKIAIILQGIFLSLVVAFCVFYRRVRSRRSCRYAIEEDQPMNSLTKKWASFHSVPYYLLRASSFGSFSSLPTLESSVQAAVEAKRYEQIPDLLVASKQSYQKPNPFSFLSAIPHHQKTQIVDGILQSLISVRPQHRTQTTYSCLLSFSLQNANPLPLAFVILQCTLRSGCSPAPQTHLSLSDAWLDRRRESNYSVAEILLEMKSIGYDPDTDTCNYLIVSLCAVDRLTEAVNVLKGMSGAGCVPDLESYDHVICKMCRARKIKDVFELVKKMVEKMGLAPREGTILKVVRAMRAKREIWRAFEIIEILEKVGLPVGFEIYELVVEGCLQYREYVLAGKVVMRMAARGFIPYIEARLKVVEGLASVGELGFASAVRHKFVEFNS